MKFKSLLITIILLNLYFIPLTAQNFVKVKKDAYKIEELGFKEAWKHVKKGNKYFRMNKKGTYFMALDHYLSAFKHNEDNAALNYLIGICYLKTSEPVKALKYIDNAYLIDENLTEDILYWLGRAKQYNYKFDDAINDYEEYTNGLPLKKLQRKKTNIDKRIEECEGGIKLMKNPVRCFVDNLGKGVNTEEPEYSPVFFFEDSILYFTSRRENTTGGKINPHNRMYYEDVYISKAKNGKWGKAEQMDKPINSIHNDAVVDISPEGKELCIYKGYKGNGNLYNSQFKNDSWQKPGKMRKINTGNYRESSVSITKDSMTIYFISNRKGGQGRQDIWVSEKNKISL